MIFSIIVTVVIVMSIIVTIIVNTRSSHPKHFNQHHYCDQHFIFDTEEMVPLTKYIWMYQLLMGVPSDDSNVDDDTDNDDNDDDDHNDNDNDDVNIPRKWFH